MANIQIPLVGVSDNGRTPDINSHKSMNLMPMTSNTGAKDNLYWISSPGLEAFATIAGVVRGMHEWNGDIYFVSGTTLYKCTSLGVVSTLGTGIASSSNPCVFTHNESQLAFVQGDAHIYVWDGTTFYDVTKWSDEWDVTAIAEAPAGTYTVTLSSDHGATTGDKVILVDSTNSLPVELIGPWFSLTTVGGQPKKFTITATAGLTIPSPFPSGVLAEIQHTALDVTPTHIVYMDSYGVINNTTNAADKSVLDFDFFVSKSSDFRIWGIANTASAQREPDPLVAMFPYQGDIWLFGSKSIETYYNSGASSLMPFEPTRPSSLPWGCVGPYTVKQGGSGLIFLGVKVNGNPTVLLTNGYDATPVATKALEYELGKLTSTQLADATAYCYRDEGGEYYCLTFDNQTWVFDPIQTLKAGIPMWHQRMDSNGDAARPTYHVFVANKHIVSDRSEARLMQLTRDVNTEMGESVERYGISGALHSKAMGIIHECFICDMEHPDGVGDISLSWSDDGGHNYSTPVTTQFTGRGSRTEIFGLGYARQNRVYKISIDADFPVNINSAYVSATACEW